MMLKKICVAAATVTLLASAVPAEAADKPKNEKKHVKSGLYVDAKEAYAMLQSNPKAILVDVRDPIEIQFTGFTDETDIHVPFRMADRTVAHKKKPIYDMKKNMNFGSEVEAKLMDLDADENSPIIFMCRSGSRAAKAADQMYQLGYKNVYNMVNGFEGGKSKEAATKGMRNVNGWKNSGLPWSYDLNFEKMYMAEK